MVLYSSGDIRFNYRSMLGDASSATIGVQNSDGSLGTQLSYNSIFAHDELSALIYRFPSWLDLEISESSLAPGGSLVLELLFDANNLEEGVYEYQMVLETNDFQQPYVYVPITLTVNGDACGDWVVGDLNQDNIYNVLDVILTVNLVLSDTGIPECELYSADINQDGILNILDVLLVINLVLDN